MYKVGLWKQCFVYLPWILQGLLKISFTRYINIYIYIYTSHWLKIRRRFQHFFCKFFREKLILKNIRHPCTSKAKFYGASNGGIRLGGTSHISDVRSPNVWSDFKKNPSKWSYGICYDLILLVDLINFLISETAHLTALLMYLVILLKVFR